ncbi:hypothetical protein MTF65_29005 [Streptomyces sp. APSN-46.1]|uniref:hypothetical protein n=1 Tax=Streptomyces sp. APSN-46.1 TaxID=2929049 RepID=UPI001FB3AD36|nr:hypothetical protein [Streptomyces sp. APSN-46.1]MCJ1681324.1 hypothetical protein [Streptomyces sp. APSN-46.1]
MTRRLDPGAGWYGEFLRRDPEGMRACLNGVAMPPWDVVESLLLDAGAQAPEAEYAAGLRAAAVTAWDLRPGGVEELRNLLTAAVAERAASRAALRNLTARLAVAADPAEADALARELPWAQDDAARAAARYEDLTSRLTATPHQRPSPPNQPPPAQPAHPTQPQPSAQPERQPEAQAGRQAEGQAGRQAEGQARAQAGRPTEGQVEWLAEAQTEWPTQQAGARAQWPTQAQAEALAEWPAQAQAQAEEQFQAERPTEGQVRGAGTTKGQAPAQAEAEPPVGRAEGRWLRGARRAGGARYAGAAVPEAQAFTPPPGHPAGATAAEADLPAPRGARFALPEPKHRPTAATPPTPAIPAAPEAPGMPAASAAPAASGMPAAHGASAAPGMAPAHGASAAPGIPPAHAAPAAPGMPPAHAGRQGVAASPDDGPAGVGVWGGAVRGERGGPAIGGFVGELVMLRARGRSGEAHVLLCEAAAWPAERWPGLASELGRAGLAADWATLLWEAAASLPPERLAAAAAALGEAGRDADCDTLLRQGVARPTAEIADAAQALGAAGRTREADALLGAFVRVRTAEEAAALARRAPQWFAPRLLRAARAISASSHRDLVHALRVAGIGAA